jgi:hypothetical protein
MRLEICRQNAENRTASSFSRQGGTLYCTASRQPTRYLVGIYDYSAKSFHLVALRQVEERK